MSLAQRTARSLSLTTACQGMQFVLQLGTASILGRLIAPADYGLFAMAVATSGLVTLLRDCGIGQAAIRRDSLTAAEQARLHWISVGFAMLSSILVLAVAPWTPWFFGSDRLPPLVMALAGPPLLHGFAVLPQVRLSREHRFRELALLSFAAAVGGLLVAVSMAWWGFGLWSLVGQLYAVAASTVLGSWWLAPVPLRGGGGAHVRPVLAHGIWLAVSEVAWMAEGHLQRALLGRLFDEHALGQLQRPKDIIDLPVRAFVGPLTNVAIPVLASVLSEPDRFRRAVLRTAGAAELMLTIPVALLIGCAQDGLLLLLGPNWLSASNYCFWLAFLSVGQGGILPMHWLLVLTARGRRQVVLQLVGSAIMLSAVGLGAMLHGPLGSVLGAVVGNACVAMLRVFVVLPIASLPFWTWARQHLPLWGLQVVAGVVAHHAARAVGVPGSPGSLLVGGLVAVGISGSGLLLPPGTRRGLRDALGALRRGG